MAFEDNSLCKKRHCSKGNNTSLQLFDQLFNLTIFDRIITSTCFLSMQLIYACTGKVNGGLNGVLLIAKNCSNCVLTNDKLFDWQLRSAAKLNDIWKMGWTFN